ncbi:MAG TPA: hypothetical protein P5096_03710 [Patescibacteria group bacterium]|nr:hypothetical protein [Patescibacteria group bacterium]
MIKKLINYLAIGLMTFAIVAPVATSAAGLSLTSAVANITSGNKVWTNSVNAANGNSVLFAMNITNGSATPATGVMARVTMPAGLQYTAGYSKVYYKDLSGADKVAPVADAIASAAGTSLGIDIPAGTTAFVTYKATVSAASGSFAPDNQVMANGGVALSANNASVVAGGASVPASVTTGTPATSSVGDNTNTSQPQVYLASSLYNLTKGETAYNPSVNASAGDELIYRMTITNRGSSAATILHARAIMPAGIEYVPGFAKLYYEDATGTDQVIPIADAINGAGNGVILPDLAGAHWFYLTYKVKVSGNTAAGTYAADNQVIGSGISLSDNNGLIAVGTTINTNVTLASSLYNLTKGDKAYTQSVNANPGDELIYRMTITNRGSSAATILHARAIMPAGIEYVPGFAKLYYEDATGTDQVIPIADAINGAGNGVILPDLAGAHWFYLTYKVKVSGNTAAGTYAADNQVIGSGISLSDNNGIITVSGEPTAAKNLFVNATAYNSTAAKSIGFNNVVSANRGDVIKFHVDFANVGNAELANVKLTNALPKNMEFVAGSVKVVLSGNTTSTADSSFSNGISLGDLSVGATGYYEFSAKVKSDTPSNISQLTYSANGTADGITSVSSLVTINLGGGAVTTLPSSGTSETVLALILLAAFISIASYIYMKESGNLDKALKVINR